MLDALALAQGTPLVSLSHVTERVQTINPVMTAPSSRFTYIDLSAVDQGTKKIVAPQSLLGEEAPSRARQLIKGGDVLVSTVRPNLNGVALVPEEYAGSVASTGFCVLRPVTRAVQRCRLAVTESALQHLMVEVRRLIARGIPELAIV